MNTLVTILLFAVLGFAAAPLLIFFLNRMPDKCFCDYDETPNESHQAPRFFFKKEGWICGLLLSGSFVLLAERFLLAATDLRVYFIVVLVGLFLAALVMIALADLKFSIIPDELVIVAAILAVIPRLAPRYDGQSLFEYLGVPVLGALVGAGLILAINLIGRLIYKKDALGMGDLKLMAACGILCGPTWIIVAFLIGVLAAGICFAIFMVAGKMSGDQYRPLGPFLVFGVLFTICCQPTIQAFINWYLSLL